MGQQNHQKKMVSCVIPAFNEASRIARVLEIVCTHPDIAEVIVVDDGSKDNTAEIAKQFTTNVIIFPENRGKAQAMDAGVKAATYDVILFLDADVKHLTHEKINTIMIPVVEGRYGMYCGLRDKKVFWVNKFVRLSPIITGDRAVRREIWDRIPAHYKQRFQIEIAMNFFAKKSGLGMGFDMLKGSDHERKYEKYGWLHGWLRYLAMLGDLIWVGIKVYIGENVKWWGERIFYKK